MSGFPPSRLGFGCYGLGGAYGKNLSPAKAIQLIQLAYDLGVRFFDTADAYGSEEILGRSLRPFRNEVAIATKVGAAGGLGRKQIVASCEASLKRLGVDWLDLYQIHYDDPGTRPEAVIATLEDLKNCGKIRYYGVGHLPLAKTKSFLKLGRPLTVLTEFSAVATAKYDELRPLQHDYSFGIIAFSVTGRGLLTGANARATAFASSDIRRLDPLFQRSKLASGLRTAKKLKEIGARLQATPAQIAIAWVLSKPGVAAALTGPTNPEHLRENCASLAINLGPELLREIDEFCCREQTRVQADAANDIQTILSSSPAPGPQAIKDLIYVLEHAVESALIPPAKGEDLFRRLLAPQLKVAGVEEIKEAIKGLLSSTGNKHA